MSALTATDAIIIAHSLAAVCSLPYIAARLGISHKTVALLTRNRSVCYCQAGQHAAGGFHTRLPLHDLLRRIRLDIADDFPLFVC